MTIKKDARATPQEAKRKDRLKTKVVRAEAKKSPGPARVQKTLNRYRKEMAEDAAATGSPEDNL